MGKLDIFYGFSDKRKSGNQESQYNFLKDLKNVGKKSWQLYQECKFFL